ncbi:hypothetical protein AMJ85_04655 [candidate division BRC1 bacterium SM23_51]|nr:MAG: hypothetical protein AMJ85_04655 [candidate division BRC1 bacterium SM23_51]
MTYVVSILYLHRQGVDADAPRRPWGRNQSREPKAVHVHGHVYGFPQSAFAEATADKSEIRLHEVFGGQVRNSKAEHEYESEHEKICAKCIEV